MSKPKFLAEGEYGCVHKPSLHCDKKKIDYNNKVSKLMLNKDALQELSEYILINDADPDNKYHLGKPEVCKPDTADIQNITAIKKCSHKDKLMNKKNTTLIIMNDGGVNLEQFSATMHKQKTEQARSEMEKFWIDVHRLFMGLRAFIKHKIIHHDLKAPNIVYNPKTHRCNYIDFGLMEYVPNSIKKCKKDIYEFGFNHWNFPIESSIISIDDFTKVKAMDTNEKHKFIKKIVTEGRKNGWLNDFFSLTYYTTVASRKTYLLPFVDFIHHNIDECTYDQFITKYFETVDIFGLGLSLIYVLEQTEHLIDETLCNSLKNIFRDMLSSNIKIRPNIATLIDRYEKILATSGILDKHNLYITSHKLDIKPANIILLKDDLQEVILKKTRQIRSASTKVMSKIMNRDPIRLRSSMVKPISGGFRKTYKLRKIK